jgi:tetratricopeptide (TPR) repeat protein
VRGLSAQQRYALAQQLHQQGRYAEAESHYRQLLSAYGEYDGLLTRLGEVCFRQRHLEDAAAFYRRAAAVAPRNPGPYLDLGNTLASLGRSEEALAAYAKATEAAPDSVEARHAAGTCLARLGRLSEAVAQFEIVLARQPDHVACLYDRGVALLLLGRTQQGVDCLERAIRLRPDFVQAYDRLVAALQDTNQHEEAVEWLGKLVALVPDQVRARNLFGRSLSVLGRTEEADSVFQEALAIAPDNAETQFEIGKAWQLRGRFAEARRAIERAIALAPDVPAYWHLLVQGETIREGDRAIATLEGMAERSESFSDADQAVIHFALAKVYDDLTRTEQAFASLSRANALQRRLTPYQEARELAMLRMIAARFSTDFLARNEGCGDPSQVPVFIVGMPRSGTTLVEQILASHPAVYGTGELGDLARLYDSLGAGGRALTREELASIGGRYVDRLRRKAPQALRITDKMPGNFASVGLIRLALPGACIIHVRRNPVETCFSCYRRLFNYGHLYTYDLGELGRYYRGYEALMEHWRHALPQGAMLEVSYEELIADFEPQARRIVAYCGLDWDPACLSFHKTERTVDTASAFQVRQPLYGTSIDRAHAYERWLGPLRDALSGAGP